MDDLEARVRTLEDEFQATKEELKLVLLDIRAYLMALDTPLPAEPEKVKSKKAAL